MEEQPQLPPKAEEKEADTSLTRPSPAPVSAASEAPTEIQKKKAAKRKSPPKKDKTISVKAKRKTSVARASLKPGKGNIRINGRTLGSIEFDIVRDMILEPLSISDSVKDVAKKVDIKINVYGGGVSSQMQAIRGALAKGIVAFSGNEVLKKQYLTYDRALIVDDPRRVEPKKFKGPKARARFQTSYR